MYINPTTGQILHWVVSACGLLMTAYLVPGFEVGSFGSALIAAVVIGIANWTVRPLLVVLTLPFTVITGGLFLFVVYGLVLKMCALVVPKFNIKGWIPAIIGAFVLSLLDLFLHMILI
jgi:putative membrane protein